MFRKLSLALAVLAGVGLLGGKIAAAAEDGPIIIGAAVAQSGFMTAYDDAPMKALQMAIDDYNAKGGILGRQIELIISDTKSDPAGAARAGAEVLEQGADFVVTSCDFDFGGPAALAANNKQIVAFGTCAADPNFGVQGIGKYAFTMGTATAGISGVYAEWTYRKKGWRTVYLMKDIIVEYTKSVCDYFKERWIELAGEDSIVGEDQFNSFDMAIPVQVSRLQQLPEQPDFIMFCSGGPGFPPAIKQIRSAGIDTPIFGPDATDGDYWLEAIPDLSDFYYGGYGSIFGDDPDPGRREFVERFKERYGDKPVSSQVLTGYSVIEAFALAAERAGSLDSDAVVAELQKFDNEALLAGPTSFSADMHINLMRGQLILEIQNGKHRAIEWHAPEKVPMPRF